MSPVRRQSLAILALFLFAILWNGLVHMVILADLNVVITPLRRTAADGTSLAVAIVTMALTAALFVLSHCRWPRSATLIGAARHALFFGVLAGILVDLNQFGLYPLPPLTVATWFAFGLIEFQIDGQICRVLGLGEK